MVFGGHGDQYVSLQWARSKDAVCIVVSESCILKLFDEKKALLDALRHGRKTWKNYIRSIISALEKVNEL